MNNNALRPFTASAPKPGLFPWLVVFLLLLARSECFAGDFGLVINQNPLFTDGELSSGTTEYAGTFIPWFAAPLGGKADLYLSGGLSIRYDNKEWKPLLEIYRSEVIWYPCPDLRLDIGRGSFKKRPAWVAAGLFDGISAELNLAGGARLGGGLYYTGLLYKKAAYIYMSPGDQKIFSNPDQYFASRRFLARLDWEKTSLFNTRSDLSLSGLCQFDLNGNDTRIHSQYLEAAFTMPLGAAFNTVSGFVFETAQETGRTYAAFAAGAEVQWMLPGSLPDMFTLTGRFSSGNRKKEWGPFIPLSAEAQGRVLRPMLSGIALLEAAYTARFYQFLSADISAAYYFRTDRTTYSGPGIDTASSSPLLGAEIYGGLSWAPYSDVLLSIGGGVFLPRTGKVFFAETKTKYRIELTAGISL
jgi:hypothetical protein